MPAQALFAVGFFAVLFIAFVVLPSKLRKRHEAGTRDDVTTLGNR